MPSRLGFLPLWLSLFPAVAPAQERTWTDKTGQNRVLAEFVDANGSQVWLKPVDGPALSIAAEELSKADRDFVADLLRREKAQRKLAPADSPGSIGYGRPRELAALASPRLDELSGMACSRRHPGLFWAHNDSGDEPRLYLFDLKGRDLGSCLLAGVRNFDWEDMASLDADGKHYLLVADTGNNAVNAAVHMIHLIEEPPCDPNRGVLVEQAPVLKTIYFAFEDDFRNCEAAGIDPTDKSILLVSKERKPACCVYRLPWPKDEPFPPKHKEKPPEKALRARLIGTLPLRQVTGMDVSPDGRRAIVLTYGDAYEYTRAAGEDWSAAFAKPPRLIELPPRVQGEAICYGPDGKTVYTSSEKRPTPLIEIPLRAK